MEKEEHEVHAIGTKEFKKNVRKSGYKPEYCQMVIDLMESGAHHIEVAAALGIKKTALQEWERDNPEFKEAMDIGRAASTAKWISKTRERAFGESRYGSDRLLEFMLKNKDPEFREHDKEIARISSSGNNSITALSSDTLLSILNDLKNASDER